jgi:MFS family permease
VSRVVTTRTVDEATAASYLAPRDDSVVGERQVEPNRFTAASGPFERYERTVEVRSVGGGQAEITQVVDYRLAIPFWRAGFDRAFRRMFARDPAAPKPWWWFVAPDRLEPRESTVLALLATMALVSGYLGTLISQTLTFSADEFGVDEQAQGATLSAVRAGVLLAFAVTALADRRGRRRLLSIAAAAACVVTATGALAPNLVWLGASQTVARGLTAGVTLLLAIISAEEMPRNSRAYAVSLIIMAGALGAGMCLWALPLADTSEGGWRILYLLPLAGLPVVAWVSRRLPETRRFVISPTDVPIAGHGRRFWLLAVTGFLLASFAAPASQFQNEFLRDDRGFSAARISLFVILTTTPGVIGIVIGGRLADERGRRVVGAVGIVSGTVLTVAMFAGWGWAMWLLAAAGTIAAALTVPSLGVYRPELFPTSLRGRAAGAIETVTLVGSAAGLLVVGSLAERWGTFTSPLALLAVPSLMAALVIVLWFPETAHRELEELNPEDLVATTDPALSPAPPATA